MDILGKSNRFSYVAAWGSIAFLAADLVFGSTVIVQLEGPSYVTGNTHRQTDWYTLHIYLVEVHYKNRRAKYTKYNFPMFP